MSGLSSFLVSDFLCSCKKKKKKKKKSAWKRDKCTYSSSQEVSDYVMLLEFPSAETGLHLDQQSLI